MGNYKRIDLTEKMEMDLTLLENFVAQYENDRLLLSPTFNGYDTTVNENFDDTEEHGLDFTKFEGRYKTVMDLIEQNEDVQKFMKARIKEENSIAKRKEFLMIRGKAQRLEPRVYTIYPDTSYLE